LDKQIGRFISELDKMGKLDNTIILFASDNDPTDWPHYYNPSKYHDDYKGGLYAPGFTGGLNGRKWSLYEGGIREPFIVYWKGHTPKGKVDNNTIIAAMDIFPPICSLLGFESPNSLDGTDKSQAFTGNEISDVPPIMWEYASNPGGSIQPGNENFRSPNLAIRDGDWKLLMNADYSDILLFNLKSDPGEKINLAKIEKDKVTKLAEKVMAWRKTMPVEIAVNH
jgi:arylsulfatase A-like enzyme